MQVRLPAVFLWSVAALMTKQWFSFRPVSVASAPLSMSACTAGWSQGMAGPGHLVVQLSWCQCTSMFLLDLILDDLLQPNKYQSGSGKRLVWADVNVVFELRYAPTDQPSSGHPTIVRALHFRIKSAVVVGCIYFSNVWFASGDADDVKYDDQGSSQHMLSSLLLY